MWQTGNERTAGWMQARSAHLTRVVRTPGAQLLQGCPVMTAGGTEMGEVDHLMIDAVTRQLRYVMVRDAVNDTTIAIPWQSLYFDAALGRLVFYTMD